MKLLDDLKERRGYSHLKEEALDRTVWRARFGRGFGPVVRQTTKCINSVLTRYAKLAAGEQLCRRCTHTKLLHSNPLKFSPEKSQNLSFDTLFANDRYNGRLWKDSISCIGLHKGKLRHLAGWGGGGPSGSMFIGPETVSDTFFCHASLRGFTASFLTTAFYGMFHWAQAS